jgi:hypothetical protein
MKQLLINKEKKIRGYKLVEVEIVEDVLFEKKNNIWHINSRFFLDWKAYRKFREMIDIVDNRKE